MCFNPMITWATGSLGIATFVFLKAKHKPPMMYFPPAYFGFMEILQGLMYIELEHPSNIFLKLLVYLAYIHVCFQPLMINYWLGNFISPDKKGVHRFILQLCFLGGLFLLSRIFTNDLIPLCPSIETLCSKNPSIFYGEHHIAWSLPLNLGGWSYITPSIFLHMFLFFIPGVLLGLSRLMIVFFLLGPYLSSMITSNPSEQSSIWCVMGLWLLVITILLSYNKLPRLLFPNQQR